MKECDCYAHSINECVCGAWEDSQKAEIEKLKKEHKIMKEVLEEFLSRVDELLEWGYDKNDSEMVKDWKALNEYTFKVQQMLEEVK